MSTNKAVELLPKPFGKAIAMPTQEDVITKEVALTSEAVTMDGSDYKKFFSIVGSSGMALVTATSFIAGLPIFNAMASAGPVQLAASLGVWLTANVGAGVVVKKASRRAMEKIVIYQEVPDGTLAQDFWDAMKKAKKERVLLNSFDIHEPIDIEITSWKEQKESDVLGAPTHTIKHYLVRQKGTYRLEQETTANEESIWDVSADALVVMYNIQETEDPIKETIA